MATNDRPESEFPHSIGKPATRALVEAGYTRVEQLNGVSEKTILSLHGVGPKAIKILKAVMIEKGLSFSE